MYICIQLYVHAFIKNYTVYGYVNFLEVVEGNYYISEGSVSHINGV